MDKLSYSLGIGIGSQLLDLGANLNVDDFSQAVKDVLQGDDLEIEPEDAQKIVSDFLREADARKRNAMMQKGKEAKENGEKYLAENAKNEGVVVLPSGLQYKVLTEGSGKKPKATDSVRCHYEGRLTDGKVFDSSYKRGEPATFPLNGVIAGWTEGVQLMNEGAKYRFFIPYNLAYGENGAGAMIPPFAALVFDVELIKVL